jgi:hypothetical protein
MNIARIDREIHKLKTVGHATARISRTPDAHNRITRLMDDRHEFDEWKQELDDKALAKKAAKIGVYLDEIEFHSPEEDSDFGRNYGLYYCSGTFGNELFRDEFRKPLLKAVREREPIYRRERWEAIETYSKLLTAVVTAMTGIIGAAIGLFAILKR